MTSPDERLERYLHDRSTTIDLPHAGVDVITRRARRHRRRRSAVVGGAVAAVLLGGTAVVIGGQPDGQEQVGSLGAAVVDSPLEWSIAPVRSGLGWGSATISDGDAVYSLSTAPGAEGEAEGPQARRLYRSEDGTDWEDVALPEGLFASSLSAADGSLYAVGTAAAGGDVTGVELATSSDGGEGWDTSSVPLDLAALGDGFPGRVRAVDAEVAVSGGSTVVAVSVAGTVDAAQLLPDEPADTWYQTEGGLTRVTDPCAWAVDEGGTANPADPSASTSVPATTMPPTTTTGAAPPAGAEDVPTTRPQVGADGAACDESAEPTEELRTWADLGLSAEQAALADGRTHVFAAGAEGVLAPTGTLPMGTYADPSENRLLAADDGFWLVTEERGAGADPMAISFEVVALHSTDGRDWTPTSVGEAQGILTAGVVDGRPVAVTIGAGTTDPDEHQQPVIVSRIEGDGVVTPVGLNELVGIPPSAGISAWAVGPLGVAVAMAEDPASDDVMVLTSPDGLAWSSQPLPAAEDGTTEVVNGITVTPDAIKVRLNVREDGSDPASPASAQRLFVGTPTR